MSFFKTKINDRNFLLMRWNYVIILCQICYMDLECALLTIKLHNFPKKYITYLPKRLKLFALKPLQLCFCKDGHWILLLLWNIAKVGIFRVTDPWSWGWWHITVYHENGSVAQNMPTLLIKNQSDIKHKY